MSKVIIIGAGLAGSLLAIYLAKRGIAVDVYEARGDMRLAETSTGRSINLALSDRGIAALRQVGMDEYMLAEAIPMYGRMIHAVSGETRLLPYSGRKGEFINSVSRAGLNIALINEAEKYPGVRFIFNERCIEFDRETGSVKFESGSVADGDTLIATDGAGSVIRQSLEEKSTDFSVSTIFLEHGYKELHIPPGPDRGFAIDKGALHIWPRHKFMMIALPNFDGSFTCTLFLAYKGRNSSDDQNILPTGRVSAFDNLTTEDDMRLFFEENFPDAVPLMPTLAEDFFHNPVGQLGTVKCWPWNIGGKVLLLGDSAHAMVPFYGQGMNCAFEDVRVLDSLLSEPGAAATGSKIDWEQVFTEYGNQRKVNTDAIADMAEENFYEMRDAVADPVFVRKRELETKLEQTYPDYFSKYSMVTFREDLPYSLAKKKGAAQDRLLMEICAGVESVAAININDVHTKIAQL